MAGGAIVLVAMLFGAIQFDPAVMAGGVRGGARRHRRLGLERSTAKEAAREIAAAEAAARR